MIPRAFDFHLKSMSRKSEQVLKTHLIDNASLLSKVSVPHGEDLAAVRRFGDGMRCTTKELGGSKETALEAMQRGNAL